MAEGVLPPAIEEFVADATKWVAGVDEMIASNDRLMASIREVDAAAKESALAGAEGGAGAEAGALGAGEGAAAGEAATAAAGAEREQAAAAEELSGAQKAAADSARLFAEVDAQMGDTALVVNDALRAQAKAMTLTSDANAGAAEKTAASTGKIGGHFKMMGLAVAAGVAYSIHEAGNFQQALTRLVTSAGESAKNLSMVGQGLKNMSVDTNTSLTQLGKGMYYVESAGFHGAAGLTVLKAAAQGAQAEGADLGTVADAVTSGLNAYGLGARSATAFTNMMVTAVGRGKMTMQDLASSLSGVLPVAAKAGLSFAQVGGAIATMTAQGMSARQATMDLRHVIMSLQNPNQTQINEMQQLGINSVKLSKNLGKEGLAGTLDQLSSTILHNMGKSGLVLLKSFNQSKLAAQSAGQMYDQLPPKLQKLAHSYETGGISAKGMRTDLLSLSGPQSNLMKQWEATENTAKGFNSQLKAGGGNAQTFAAALSKATGGITGTQVALMLGGHSAGVFNQNIKAIAASSRNAGSNVQGWALIQHNFNFQLGQAEKAVQSAAVSFGQVLLPAVTAIVHVVAAAAGWFAKNAAASKVLAGVIGGVLAIAFERKLAHGVAASGEALKNLGKDFQAVWKGAQQLWGWLTKGSAAEAENAAATDVQAASSDAAAVSADVQAGSEEALAGATDVATGSFWAFTAALLANPITLIIVALVALVAGFVLLWDHCAAFRNFWKAAWRDIKGAAEAVWHWIKSNWPLLLAILLGPIAVAALEIARHWHQIENVAKSVWNHVVSIVKDAWKAIKDAISAAINAVKSVIEGDLAAIAAVWRTIWSDIEAVARFIWNSVLSIVRYVMGLIQGAIAVVLDVIHGHWSAAWNALKALASSALHGAVSVVLGIASSFGSLLFNAGKAVVEGLIHGITSMFGSLGSVVGSLASKVAGFFGLSPAKEGPLSGGGAPEIRGLHFAAELARGITTGAPQVDAAIRNLLGSPGLGGRGSSALSSGLTTGGSAYLPATGGGGGTVQVQVNLENTMSGPSFQQWLQTQIQHAVLDYALRNAGSFMVLPGRKA